ncbi:PKD domain-containing protein [Lewinella sp. JB7]|uniref:PKD domain-containing protein n=1 Tax=Lewinella sp. JB7 TaxID=2962887 RepID=UPI0020C9D0A8|nr:PKD domain-containing protein [Lewinella sp. JB7]MCP9235896.1 PKD domain-containing protein [Lewinella sp. JB7]
MLASLPYTVQAGSSSQEIPGDRDNDGIPDEEDTCPDRANRDQLLFNYYPDADGDSYGTDEGVVQACDQPAGYTTRGGDCNDTDPDINPGALDVNDVTFLAFEDEVDGIDNNCDGSIDEGLIGSKDRSQPAFYEPECAETGSDWTLKLDKDATNQRYFVVENGRSTLTVPGNDPQQRIRIERFIDSHYDIDKFSFSVKARKSTGNGSNSLWIRANDGEWSTFDFNAGDTFDWFTFKLPRLEYGNNNIDIVSRVDGTDVDLFLLDIGGDPPSYYEWDPDYRDECGGVFFDPNRAPTALATADVTSGVAPLTVRFDGSGSSDPEEDSLSYHWEWEGGSATGMTPTATFAPGIYEVTLTVMDPVRNTDQATISIVASDANVDPTTEFWLEAECAEVGSHWQYLEDTTASVGRSVVVTDRRSVTAPPDDLPENRLRFYLYGAEAGNYRLFARISAPGPDNDSYWVRVNEGPWLRWRDGIRRDGSYAWNRYRDHLLSLTDGDNTVDFAYRESNTELDKIHLNLTGEMPTGLGLTASNCTPFIDTDGDGVADDQDNCPNLPNPDQTLPIFYGDFDGDGYGDPDDTVRACTAPVNYVDNDLDNCPALNTLYNIDSDNDGVGDACDEDYSGPTNFWLEAECGMVSAGWRPGNFGGASNGKYRYYLGQPHFNEPTATDPAAELTFPLTITEAGDYQVFLRMNAVDNGKNSFWVRFDQGEWVQMWQEIGGTQLKTSGFEWKQVNDSGIAVSFPLVPGDHTLTIANREPGTQLDKVFITARSAAPTDVGLPAGNCGAAPLARNVAVPVNRPPITRSAAPDLSLYPNPVADELTLETTSLYVGQVLARIYDVNGRMIRELTYDKAAERLQRSVDVRAFAPGVYRLQLIEGDRQVARSFVRH